MWHSWHACEAKLTSCAAACAAQQEQCVLQRCAPRVVHRCSSPPRPLHLDPPSPLYTQPAHPAHPSPRAQNACETHLQAEDNRHVAFVLAALAPCVAQQRVVHSLAAEVVPPQVHCEREHYIDIDVRVRHVYITARTASKESRA